MTDTRDPQTEMERTEAEEAAAESSETPEKTLEEQCRETVCPTCTVKTEADDARLRAPQPDDQPMMPPL